jgi:hypothetical protein
MRIQIYTVAATAALCLSAASVPAHAFDLTGHWTGKWSCKGFDGTKFTSGNKESTLAITQSGGTFAAAIDASTDNFTYNGVAITDIKDANKGEVVLLGCHLANTLPAGQDDGELVRASVKTKLDTFKASFKGTSLFTDAFPEVGTCKYSYKRIDTTDPAVGPCE